MPVLFWIFWDQICPKWINLDQIGFPRKSKNVTTKHKIGPSSTFCLTLLGSK